MLRSAPLEDGRHAEFPLHQVSHQHHQVTGEALIHKEITFVRRSGTAVLLDGSINFLEEVFTDAVVLHQHLAQAAFSACPRRPPLRGFFEQTLEVEATSGTKADIGRCPGWRRLLQTGSGARVRYEVLPHSSKILLRAFF